MRDGDEDEDDKNDEINYIRLHVERGIFDVDGMGPDNMPMVVRGKYIWFVVDWAAGKNGSARSDGVSEVHVVDPRRIVKRMIEEAIIEVLYRDNICVFLCDSYDICLLCVKMMILVFVSISVIGEQIMVLVKYVEGSGDEVENGYT
ncbi:hypothetical protein Tco_1071703, partial [Tanacetum coccineum]